MLFTDDVEPYEQVKLRMLNASHSTLALPGVLMGYRLVDEAMGDEHLAALLEQFLRHDVEPQLTALRASACRITQPSFCSGSAIMPSVTSFCASHPTAHPSCRSSCAPRPRMF